MSALAHGVEAQGIPTTVVGLVRLHLEKSLPPRSLFVPFELGRPLGEPGDAGFQRDVLLAALRLLERADGPVLLEDFARDAPGSRDTPDWRPPFTLPSRGRPAAGDPNAWREALAAEIALIGPHHAVSEAQRGRTTVGLSGLGPAEWPEFAAALIGGAVPEPPAGLPTAAVAARFLVDDLKAFYGEAVLAHGPHPSSRQLDHWFWGETFAGLLVRQLRLAGLASENNALRTVAGRFFVPGRFVDG